MHPFFADQYATEHIAQLHREARASQLAKTAKKAADKPGATYHRFAFSSMRHHIGAAMRRIGQLAVSPGHR